MIPCPEEDCSGHIEAFTRVYLDIEAGTLDDEGALTIEDMQFSHLNDHFDGLPCNLEGEFEVCCSDCGREFNFYTAPSMADRIAPQPIGNAPRTTGRRGGT